MERYRPFWGVQTDVHDRCFSSSSLDELLSKSASAGIGSSVRGGMELSSSFSSSPINFVDFAGLRGGFDPERNPFTGYKFIQGQEQQIPRFAFHGPPSAGWAGGGIN